MFDKVLQLLGLPSNQTEDELPYPEPTAAPYNVHPMEVDMTVQPSNVLTSNWINPIKVKEVLITIIRRSTESPASTETSPTNQVNFYSEQTTMMDSKLVHPSTPEWLEVVTTERPHVEDNTSVYIIAALSLIILIGACMGIIMWCKNNRLKAERRNEYPVYAVSNQEYMDPHKLKNVP